MYTVIRVKLVMDWGLKVFEIHALTLIGNHLIQNRKSPNPFHSE